MDCSCEVPPRPTAGRDDKSLLGRMTKKRAKASLRALLIFFFASRLDFRSQLDVNRALFLAQRTA